MIGIRATVTLNKVSGLPEDAAQNVFHFAVDELEGYDPEGIRDALINFYNGNTSGADTALADIFSGTIDRGDFASKIDLYTVPDAPAALGSPAYSYEWGLLPEAVTLKPLPDECAMVLSMYSDLTGIPENTPGGAPGPVGDAHPAARRRGRLYLGPLSDNCSDAVANGTTPPRLSSVARAVPAFSANRLCTESAALDNPWCVFSRTNWAMYPVIGGWIDNAFDTQRRRGPASSARTLWTD